MNFEGFSAGAWRQQYQYKSFTPVLVNHDWHWQDPRINTLLERATRALGELNAFSLIVPDVDLFIEMHIAKEANLSSRIEGTQTAMDEALMSEELIAPEKRDDWHEVRNYVDAINMAIDELKRLPLSTRLLCQTHAILMRGVRGEHKQPGEIRNSQNWIGGSGPGDAAFVPPHPTEVADLMSDLERFWHNEAIEVPHLVRIAISHYQFETIHPFLDGNGRIGRLLIAALFEHWGLLAEPLVYLSGYLKQHQAEYYRRLSAIRTDGDWEGWVAFFLEGVAMASADAERSIIDVASLITADRKCLLDSTKAGPISYRLFELLPMMPRFSVEHVRRRLETTFPTASAAVSLLEDLGIVVELTGQKKNRIYSYQAYVELLSR